VNFISYGLATNSKFTFHSNDELSPLNLKFKQHKLKLDLVKTPRVQINGLLLSLLILAGKSIFEISIVWDFY